MPIISQKDAATIQNLFAKELTAPVAIDYYTEKAGPDSDCPYCEQTGQLLAEVSALSPSLALTVHTDSAETVPVIELKGKNQGRVRYLGIPAGYEFTSLIEDIVDISKGVTKLSAATKAKLATLTRPVHIQVFVTPT